MSSRLQAVDGWKWSYVISQIRVWSKFYPEPIPDDNTLTEAEARALLRTILQHPAVVAETNSTWGRQTLIRIKLVQCTKPARRVSEPLLGTSAGRC